MRKLAAASMIIGLAATAQSPAQELHVPAQYSSIQAAIDAAAPGGHIVVAPGLYHENLLIEKAVTLASSDGAATTVIDGGRLGPAIVARGTGAEVVEISGFTITNGLNSFVHPSQMRPPCRRECSSMHRSDDHRQRRSGQPRMHRDRNCDARGPCDHRAQRGRRQSSESHLLRHWRRHFRPRAQASLRATRYRTTSVEAAPASECRVARLPSWTT